MELDVAATVMPAAHNRSGGDFWLRRDRPDGSTFLVVGDVTGHGDSVAGAAERVSALLASRARTAADPCELLERTNAALCRAGTAAP